MGMHSAPADPQAIRKRRRGLALAAAVSALGLAAAYVAIIPNISDAHEVPTRSAELRHEEPGGAASPPPGNPAPPGDPAPPATGQPKNPGTQSKTILYGPYTVPAAVGDEDGRTRNTIERNIEFPCKDCMMTKMVPSMVYEDGSNANVDTGPGLHHLVMLNNKATDATCGGSFPNPSMFLGERFAAAGNERTVIEFPPSFGYPVAADANITMISDLMNHAEQERTVFIKVEYDFVPNNGASTLTPVRPVWMDVAPCSSILDTYEVEQGEVKTSSEWEVNVPGTVVSMGGHLHNDGVTLTAVNESTGKVLCDSTAAYGTKKDFVNVHGEAELSTMKTCIDDSLGTVERGQKVKLTSTYDSTIPRDDVMGIMVTYIAEK